ncbi:MAG: diguanylate cyclase [Burkholderiales bacterium]|jgi:diguanylate cyclase (GGDEF)-like protein|nr:diguanylate cyclase [Burkholderiales bacterium]
MPSSAAVAKQVLVVDDDATTRFLLRAALRQAGFGVTLAVDGEDALRQFSAQSRDLVMLDVEMPGLSGNEVCARMRALTGELLPIVMVTGSDDVASIEKAYDSGATDFIAKPINPALVGHRVKYLLRSAQARLDLRAADASNAAILRALPDPLFEVDIDGRILNFHAPRPRGRCARAPLDYRGKTVAEVLAPSAAQVCMQALREALASGHSSGAEVELKLPRGTQWFELSVSRKDVDAQQKPLFIVLSRNITRRRLVEQQVLRLAHFDSLTGLPNRPAFLERVNREIARARHKGSKLGVLFMDLDGFKQVNDSMGHAAGDEVLQAVADRLRDLVRPSDLVSRFAQTPSDMELARLGGDEFTALLLDLSEPADALVVAQRIRDALARPLALQGQPLTVGVSIGISIFPNDGADAAALLDRADTAMYRAKAAGKGVCELYRRAEAETVELLASPARSDRNR